MTGNIYFMGIGGTGMASVAGLLKEAGFQVTGSDAGVYPPMSDVLRDSGIRYLTPYTPENLAAQDIDTVVVANVLSRGHTELEEAIRRDLKLTSFPAILAEKILPGRTPVVVSGTHGKTTTTTLMAHVLQELGYDPGYIIGGLPRNFAKGYHLGQSKLFLLEGDEYDTAYFDKESKFLHYCPEFLIFNNLEFDHADIFADIGDIDRAFSKLLRLVAKPRHIIANVDDPGVHRVVAANRLEQDVCRVAGYGRTVSAEFVTLGSQFDAADKLWRMTMRTPRGELCLRTSLSGAHNMSNLAQAVALCFNLAEAGHIEPFTDEQLQIAVASFSGVARRLDLLGETKGVTVYEDFAHHPTSVKLVLESLRQMYPQRRLVVAFEPKNATSRRNVFTEQFAQSLSVADQVWIGERPDDRRLNPDQLLDTAKLASLVTSSSCAFGSNDELLAHALENTEVGDVVVFMSPGSFSGIQHKFVGAKERKT